MCSLFKSDAQQCVNRVVTGTVYFRALQNIVDNDKVTPEQALRIMGTARDPWVQRDAAEALGSMTPDEFKVAEMNNCMNAVNERNR
jgi:hypothetical protein